MAVRADRLLARARVIFLDTMIFIYQFERNEVYLPQTTGIFQAVEQGKVQALTSVLTMAEVLTGVKRAGDRALEKEYHKVFLTFPHLRIVPIDFHVAETAASLRAKYALRTPDALQLAAAAVHQADRFICNDASLQKVREVKVITLG